MRVLPHHQDTGGFFIAVLEKKDWLPWQRKQKRTQQSVATETKTATTENVEVFADADSNIDVTAVPKLQDLAYEAAKSSDLPEEVTENIINSESSASVGPAQSECTNNDGSSERTSMNPEGNNGNIPADEEVKGKPVFSGEQERPSKAVLGK
jgi:tRNA (cytosine34-C5)-methyltransferase